MSNLLPKSERAGITREYRLRLLAVIASLTFTLGLIDLVGLIPSLVLSYNQQGAISRETEVEQSLPATRDRKLLEQEAARAKEEIAAALGGNGQSVSAIAAAIIRDRPQGIALIGVDIAAADAKTYHINLSGAAGNREELLAFQNALEKENGFSEINLPISDLAASSNISFSLTLTAASPQP